MNGTKVTTIRLPEAMAAQLAAIARTEGVPVSEFVREAIEERMTLRLTEEGFKARMKKLARGRFPCSQSCAPSSRMRQSSRALSSAEAPISPSIRRR